MKRLPLYPDDPRLAVETVAPLARNHDCNLCDLGGTNRSTCVRSEPINWAPGGLLVVGDAPQREEDSRNKSFVSRERVWVKDLIKRLHPGPVAYTLAVRCMPKRVATSDQIDACRGYLHNTIREAKPGKILALGRTSIESLFGSKVPIASAARGYTYLFGDGQSSVPVHFLNSPWFVHRNKYLRTEFVNDLTRILQEDAPQKPPWHESARLVQTAQDATVAAKQLRNAGAFTFDVETSGRQWDNDFQIIALAAVARGSDSPWVWCVDALRDPAIRMPLLDVLADKTTKVSGQYVKYDTLSIRSAYGVQVNRIDHDTRLSRKLTYPEADATLGTMGHLVGMGGHKNEASESIASGLREVQRRIRALSKAKPTAKDISEQGTKLLPYLDPAIESLIRLGQDPKKYKYAFMPKSVLLRYCARDAVATSRLIDHNLNEINVHNPELAYAWNTVLQPVSEALDQVEAWGMGVSKDAIENVSQYCRAQLLTIDARLAPYNINPGSAKQLRELLFVKLKLPITKKTPKGEPSTDKSVLTTLAAHHPVVQDIIDHRKYAKLDGTYATGLQQHIRADGRIHPNLKPDGTRSGRWSCVVGDTPILTQRGYVAIVGVVAGDLVWTHEKRWQPVLHNLDQGVRTVYDIRLANGEVLTCTSDHRILRSGGDWITVGELLERFKKVDKLPDTPARGFVPVSTTAPVADTRADRETVGHYAPQRFARGQTQHADRRTDGATQVALFGLQDRDKESHEGQDRQSAPQLERGMRGRLRVSDVSAQRQAGICASGSNGQIFGLVESPGENGGAPYRRGSEEQRHRQSSVGDSSRPQHYPFLAGSGEQSIAVQEIRSRAAQSQVYDLTVATDHSYSAHGIFHHNCTDPNLQNLPSEKQYEGKVLRECFIAEPGHLLVSADYSQIELRVAAMLSGDKKMIEIYEAGDDFHMRTAQMVSIMAWGVDPAELLDENGDQTKKGAELRRASKMINFGLLYGMSDDALAASIGIEVMEANKLRRAILGNFSALDKWIKDQLRQAHKTGYTWTYWNGQKCRRRPLFDLADPDGQKRSTAERASWNTAVQGTAGEYNNMSMVELVKWVKEDCIPSRVIMAVHDCALQEVEEDALYEVIEGTERIMTQWFSYGVPLVVDIEVGRSWGAMTSDRTKWASL